MEAGEPSTWGPSLWRAIHFVALGYPSAPSEADARTYGAFFRSLDAVIPCGTCADNYRRHLRELPIEPYLVGGGAGRLFEWTVLLHNIVDRETGKPDSSWTPDRAYDALMGVTSATRLQQRGGGAQQRSVVCTYAVVGVALAAVLAAVVLLVMSRRRAGMHNMHNMRR